MRTTINIADDLLNDIIKRTKAKTKTEAITKALEEFIRRKRMGEIKSLFGKIKFNLDWKKLEREELKRSKHAWRSR